MNRLIILSRTSEALRSLSVSIVIIPPITASRHYFCDNLHLFDCVFIAFSSIYGVQLVFRKDEESVHTRLVPVFLHMNSVVAPAWPPQCPAGNAMASVRLPIRLSVHKRFVQGYGCGNVIFLLSVLFFRGISHFGQILDEVRCIKNLFLGISFTYATETCQPKVFHTVAMRHPVFFEDISPWKCVSFEGVPYNP